MSYSHPAPELWWLMFPEWPSRSWRAVEPTKFKCACVCVRLCVWCICGCIHPHMHSGQGRMSSVLLCRCLPYFLDTESLNEPGTGLVAANPSILLSLPLPLSTVVTGYTQLLMEVLESWTLVLMFEQRALYLLSHPLSPTQYIFSWQGLTCHF